MTQRLRRHSHWLSLAALLVALFGAGSAYHRWEPAPRPTPSPLPSLPAQSDPAIAQAPVSDCNPAFERFTYHPTRLVRLSDCVTVSGVVVKVKLEADGDDHIQFRLDKPYLGLMNASNADPSNTITRGNFIIEPDCVAGPVTQLDAQAACAGAIPPPGFALLKVGAHLWISGPWVNDSAHGHNEVHPIEKLAPITP